MRKIFLPIIVLPLAGGAVLAQTASSPVPAAVPSADVGLTGVPRIDARRAPASLPSPSSMMTPSTAPPNSSKISEPPRLVTGQPDAPPNGNRAGMNHDAIADCLRLWDKGTHMTKGEWATTCRRIQSRVDNASVAVVTPKATSRRRP